MNLHTPGAITDTDEAMRVADVASMTVVCTAESGNSLMNSQALSVPNTAGVEGGAIKYVGR